MQLVLVVQPAEEQAVEAHLGEQGGLLARVAEGVDLPADAGAGALAEGVVQFPGARGKGGG